jgi:hypothetical protein
MQRQLHLIYNADMQATCVAGDLVVVAQTCDDSVFCRSIIMQA